MPAAPARMWILCHPHNPLGRVFDRGGAGADRRDRRPPRPRRDLRRDPRRPHPARRDATSRSRRSGPRCRRARSRSRRRRRRSTWPGCAGRCCTPGTTPLHAALEALPGHYLGAPNVMAVAATEAAWTEGDDWLRRRRRRARREPSALQPNCSTSTCPAPTCRPIEATYLAWVDCRAARARRRPGGHVPRARRRGEPGPAVQPARPRRRPHPAQPRHQPGDPGRHRRAMAG